jgi:mRNA interferase RelE/StbE
MGSYSLVFKRSVAKDLRNIPRADVRKILKRIEALVDDPRPEGSKKLTQREFYRIRQGTYRIIYEIVDDALIIQVIKVAHRSKAYLKS